MIRFIFFVVAAWYLCGISGMAIYVLRPELADRFSVPTGGTINSASFVQLLLVLGWGCSFFGHSNPTLSAGRKILIATKAALSPASIVW